MYQWTVGCVSVLNISVVSRTNLWVLGQTLCLNVNNALQKAITVLWGQIWPKWAMQKRPSTSPGFPVYPTHQPIFTFAYMLCLEWNPLVFSEKISLLCLTKTINAETLKWQSKEVSNECCWYVIVCDISMIRWQSNDWLSMADYWPYINQH